jgi:hypothetical protein
MEFSKLGDNAKNCRSYMTILLDDFYYLWTNHTSTTAGKGIATQTGQEEVFFNITGIISGPY